VATQNADKDHFQREKLIMISLTNDYSLLKRQNDAQYQEKLSF
jgi:hypothetical protein